ncbi:arginine--tRNA ligase [Methanobrevibacter cuticularis]|uniref:Arginine--tRNA ligase n=1 Tax=Methanobrevibacter cuticularis TaxID=47311 RepID=A0A166CLU6_9EURY|nr:arginine--tRNA ligase [Methanobrevibacter cuticularis]KZX14645.1 arginine--tRNA ligase [Methanobrevibacter cuticularis]
MYFTIKNEALKSLEEAITKLNYEIPEEIKLEFPPNPKMGDLATTVSFQLAKALKMSPMDVTNEIMATIAINDIFEKVEAKGPYINFFINYCEFSKKLLESVDDNYGELENRDKKIILEHTSANPNGPLHIGHIRNAIIGDSLKRLLKTAGYEVDTQYYVNDMGRQIAMIVFGMEKLGLTINEKLAKEFNDLNESSNSPNINLLTLKSNINTDGLFDNKIDHQIGQLYFQVNEKLKEDETLKTEVDNLIKGYERGIDPQHDKTFEKAVNDCLIGVKQTLSKLNIKHDEFVWEGQFVRNGEVDRIVNDLIATGNTKENEVLYLDLKDFGIEKELVLRRSDGTSLYSTRDLAYHTWKSHQGDVVLDILGSDHKLAIEQISIALDLLDENTPEVIFYEFITLPEGSMSTRRGVFISVDELIQEAIIRAKKEVQTRRTDLNSDEIAKISEEIGIGAIRYYISKLSPEKHITFKWDEALSFERGCASIQYAHARACKLLEKCGKFSNGKLAITADNIENDWIPNDNETELIRTIAKFPIVVKEASEMMRVHPIAQYTQDLASSFNKFYKSEQVISCEVESARLLLVDKARITLKNSLNLLGVVAPKKM